MKASEYFEKYGDTIRNETKAGSVKTIAILLNDMWEEAKAIKAERKAMTNRAIVSILKQQNQKWNSIVSKFEALYNDPIIKRNGFYDAVNHQFFGGELPRL